MAFNAINFILVREATKGSKNQNLWSLMGAMAGSQTEKVLPALAMGKLEVKTVEKQQVEEERNKLASDLATIVEAATSDMLMRMGRLVTEGKLAHPLAVELVRRRQPEPQL